MNWKEFNELVCKQGKQAQGYAGGALRGGFVYKNNFYALGANGMVFSVPASETRGLEYAPYGVAS